MNQSSDQSVLYFSYYIELLHKENRGAALAQVGVHQYETQYTGSLSSQVLNDLQDIITTSDIINERQVGV